MEHLSRCAVFIECFRFPKEMQSIHTVQLKINYSKEFGLRIEMFNSSMFETLKLFSPKNSPAKIMMRKILNKIQLKKSFQ